MPEEHAIQVCVRSVDDEERKRLERSRVRQIAVDPADVSRTLDVMSRSVRRGYVHVDLDVIDASELRANQYALNGGPSVNSVAATIAAAGRCVPVDAAALTALDPSIDSERAWDDRSAACVDGRVLSLTGEAIAT